jgi:hypothetical protein
MNLKHQSAFHGSIHLAVQGYLPRTEIIPFALSSLLSKHIEEPASIKDCTQNEL